MARKETVKAEEYSPLHAGRTYLAIVCEIKKKSKPKRVWVKLKNLHPRQEGRVHELTLALPFWPGGRTADFFRAVGHNVEAGRELVLRDALGKKVRIEFGPSPDGRVEVVSFAPPAKEKRNAAERE